MPGQRAHEQIRRGLSRQALLRRLREHRRDRAARDRPREGAVRGRARERPAARRRDGQRGRLPRAAAAGRPPHGALAAARRPPHARHEDQRVRAALRDRAVRGLAGGLSDRHGRGRAARQGAAAEDDPRRLVGLLALPRLRALPGDRRRGRRAADGRHGALRRPGGRRGAPEPRPLRRRGHDDRAQDSRRPPLRPHPVPRGVREEDQLGRLPRASRAARSSTRSPPRPSRSRLRRPTSSRSARSGRSRAPRHSPRCS